MLKQIDCHCGKNGTSKHGGIGPVNDLKVNAGQHIQTVGRTTSGKRHPKSVLSARGNTCGKVYSDLVVLAEFINISYHSLVLWTASWVPM